MEKKCKSLYQAPALQAVELKSERIICDSNKTMIWSLSEPSLSAPTDIWSRDSYGSAQSID